MADDAGLANDRHEIEMAARLSTLYKFDKPSRPDCIQCGEDIPLKRQQLGSVTHCTDCANILERRR